MTDFLPEVNIEQVSTLELRAVDKVLRTQWADGSHRGWRCPWCDVEWTSISMTVRHMILGHPEEFAA